MQDGERRQLFKTLNQLQISTEHQTTFSISQIEITNVQAIFRTVQSHLLNNIMGYFNQNTGEPILYRQVYDWPIAENTFAYSQNPIVPVPSFRQEESWGSGLTKMAFFVGGLYLHQHTAGVVRMEHQHRGRIVYLAEEGRPDYATGSTMHNGSSSDVAQPSMSFLESNITNSASSSSSTVSQQLSQQGLFMEPLPSADETVSNRTTFRPRGRGNSA